MTRPTQAAHAARTDPTTPGALLSDTLRCPIATLIAFATGFVVGWQPGGGWGVALAGSGWSFSMLPAAAPGSTGPRPA
ncbi:hypothetical protein [Gryllotalpicola sp.]|uniref:hypothetical protein n=1 Tax=Gryllotalpicola sp. TaxID=1932787 RepID=UPI002608F1D0|nr:hypothetical protein [Gryllotalpicola sp.]